MLLLSEAVTGGALWKEASLEISQISLESSSFGVSFQLSWTLDNLRFLCWVCKVFASAYFKEHRRSNAFILMWLCLIVFHALLKCAFNIIFNHFTCCLSISRDQLSFIFSFQLVINLFSTCISHVLCFFFPWVTIMLQHTKFSLVCLLCTTCASHGCIFELPKISSPFLFCPCYDWRWASDYSNEI